MTFSMRRGRLFSRVWSSPDESQNHGSLPENSIFLPLGGEQVATPSKDVRKYFGGLFRSGGKIERESDRRIGAASAAVRILYRTVVVMRQLSLLSIYQSICVWIGWLGSALETV